MIIALLAPISIIWLIFFAWPMVQVGLISMYHTNFVTTTFVGLQNYIAVLTDPLTLTVIGNSLLYAIILVPLNILSCFALSTVLYDMPKKWRNAARIILYIPMLTAGVIISGLYKWLFHTDGLINYLIPGEPIYFFSNTLTSIPIIAVIVAIATVGTNLIIMLASFEALDTDMIEAAKVDGATRGQINRMIIWPLVLPTIVLITLLTLIGAFQIIETPMLLAPQDFAATLTYSVYRQAFLFGKYGTAAAQSVVLLIIVGLIKLRVESWHVK